jgi:hypothetical protein
MTASYSQYPGSAAVEAGLTAIGFAAAAEGGALGEAIYGFGAG